MKRRRSALWAVVATLMAVGAHAAEPAPDQGEPTDPPPVHPSMPADSVDVVAAAPPPEARPAGPVVRAAFGNGITVQSEDGRYSLQIRGRIQAQAAVLTVIKPDEPADITAIIRRMRLTFRGNLFSRDLEFYVQLGFAPRDMESDLLIPLRDAFLTWKGSRDANIIFGQKKVPFNRERVISSSSLQLVDRSIVNAELTLDRDIGLQVSSDDLGGLGGRLGYQVGVFMGDGRLRVNDGPGLLYTARIQVQPTGTFADAYVESDLEHSARARLSLGAGVAFNHDARRQRSTHGEYWLLEGFDQLHAEGDLMFKVSGLSVMSEVNYRQALGDSSHAGEVDGAPVTEVARNGLGWMVQSGYLFSPVPIEVAARFAEIRPTGDETSLTLQRELVGGLSWYLQGHDLKVQADYAWLSGEVFSEGRHQVRLQAQVAF